VRKLALVASLAALVAAVLVHAAPAGREQRSRIVDRTVTCSISVRLGARTVEIRARSGTRALEDRATWKRQALAGLRDAGDQLPPWNFDALPIEPYLLGWLTAGWPKFLEPGERPRPESLAFAPRCRPATRIPLSRSGLAGGAVGPFDEVYECPAAPRVLVRVRGVFKAPTTVRTLVWPRSATFPRTVQRAARGALREGRLAVRAPSGKPIAYAEVFESGKSRLYVSPRCLPD
jgi:hypothetical protein